LTRITPIGANQRDARPHFSEVKSQGVNCGRVAVESHGTVTRLIFSGSFCVARGPKLPGFLELLEAKSSFLELEGDAKLTAKLIDGFQEGRWRQSIEP
jgi:hypothetical protein